MFNEVIDCCSWIWISFVNMKLNCNSVSVLNNLRPSLWFPHHGVIQFHNFNVSDVDRVWIPCILTHHQELWRYVTYEPMLKIRFLDWTFCFCQLWLVNVGRVNWMGICFISLYFCQIRPHFTHWFSCFYIVKTCISRWYP
jgi:hypothetical protein